MARHSSIDLTMKAYTDLALLDLRGAVESLPSLGTPSAEAGGGAKPRRRRRAGRGAG